MNNQKSSFFIQIARNHYGWRWHVMSVNGKELATSKYYSSKSQCANVSQKVAEATNLRWTEE